MLQGLSKHGIKVILFLMFKDGSNTETIAIHLREVHYRMAIVCDICQVFSGMNAQVILEHHSGCKTKCDKEHAEQEGQEKEKKSHKKKSKSQEWNEMP